MYVCIYIHIYKYIYLITYLHIYIHTYFCFLTNINQYTHIYIFTHYIYIFYGKGPATVFFVSSDVFRSCSIKEHTNIYICLTMFTQFLFVCVVLFVCMLISHMIIIKNIENYRTLCRYQNFNLYMYVYDNIQLSVIFSSIVSTIIIY